MASSKFLSLTCALFAGAALGAEKAKFDAIVSADAPGAYRTLQEAVAAAPDNGEKPFRILLKPGTYRGQWIVPKQKRRIRLAGEVAERTIITHTLNQSEAPAPGAQPVFNNAGTVILADDYPQCCRPKRLLSKHRSGQELINAIKTASRRPVEPTLESELVADLGLDSLQLLDVIAELEGQFDISIPLEAVPATRTVAQVVAQVRRLVEERGAG